MQKVLIGAGAFVAGGIGGWALKHFTTPKDVREKMKAEKAEKKAEKAKAKAEKKAEKAK
jgi:hypothetical protein